MSNKRFRAQLTNTHLALAGQGMPWRNHEDQFIQIDNDGIQLRFLGIVRQHSQFRAVAHYIIGNVAAQSALHRDFDHGMQPAEFGQHRKQI